MLYIHQLLINLSPKLSLLTIKDGDNLHTVYHFFASLQRFEFQIIRASYTCMAS